MVIDVYGFLPGVSPEFLDYGPWTAGTPHPGCEEMPEAVRGEFFVELAFGVMEAETLGVFCGFVVDCIPADPATLNAYEEGGVFDPVVMAPFQPAFKDLGAFIIKEYYTVAAFCMGL